MLFLPQIFSYVPVHCDADKNSKDSQAQNGHFCLLIDTEQEILSY
jgi:hypothetical protein